MKKLSKKAKYSLVYFYSLNSSCPLKKLKTPITPKYSALYAVCLVDPLSWSQYYLPVIAHIASSTDASRARILAALRVEASLILCNWIELSQPRLLRCTTPTISNKESN